MVSMNRLRDVAELEPPCPEAEVAAAEVELGISLPADHRQLLLLSNGLVAKNDRTVLYGARDLLERNRTFEVSEYAPGWLMIGDDSGGQAFLVDVTEKDRRVICVDMGSMVPEDGRCAGANLNAWAESGFPYEV